MDSEKKFLLLLEKLRNATRNGSIEWEETSDDSQFRAKLGGPMVRVGHSCTDDVFETNQYSAYMLNNKAKVVESIESSHGPAFEALEDLYKLARRSARKAGDIVDDALVFIDNELNK